VPTRPIQKSRLRRGAILAIILIFPAVYVWNLFEISQRLRRNAAVAIIVTGLVLTLGGVGLVAFGIFRLAAKPSDPGIAAIQEQLAAIQTQLSASKPQVEATVVSAVGSTKKEKPAGDDQPKPLKPRLTSYDVETRLKAIDSLD